MPEKTRIKQTSKVRRNLPETLRPEMRLQRMRQKSVLRDLLAETKISLSDLVCPVIISESRSDQAIPFLDLTTLHDLPAEAKRISDLGLKAVFLQQVVSTGFDNNQLAKAVGILKQLVPDLLLIVEIACFDFYNKLSDIDHAPNYNDNDHALLVLSEQAVRLAQAGADVIAPAEMHDGAVTAMRNALNRSGFADILIMGQGARYNASLSLQMLYGEQQKLNNSGYRLDPANVEMSLRAIETVINEDADIIMLQPAQMYLDVLQRAKEEFSEVPIAALHGLADLAMIKAASERGWINQRDSVIEALVSIKRAGASFIITYFAKSMAEYLQ